MSSIKVSALTEITSTATDDVIVIVDTSAGTTNKIKVSNLIDLPTAPAGIATDTNKEYNLKLTDVSGTETLTWVEESTEVPTTPSGIADDTSKEYNLKLTDVGGTETLTWIEETDNDTTYTASDFKLDDLAVPDDNTDLDFSTTKHGLTPKGTNTGKFLKDDGTWGTPTDTDTDTTYTTATASALGLIKIEDNTDQTVAANAVSSIASRTYGVQLNASDQAVVNVPWTEGASTTKGFYEHPKEITTAVTISTDYNAVTVGPITYSGAGSITVPSGSTWVIL
jgi:hypothetical protein